MSTAGACSGSDDEKDEEYENRPVDCTRAIDTSSYDYSLEVAWSQRPPAGFAPKEVPQFVALGWDDNGFQDPFDWSLQMLADRGLKASYFMTTTYISDGATTGSPGPLRTSWNAAYLAGHDVGNHTQYHLDGTQNSSEDWAEALDTAFTWLTNPLSADAAGGAGIPREELFGFRSPFLHYNDELYGELRARDIWYDCSIEEGFQLTQNARSFTWPYTLDHGSPAHDYAEARDFEAREFDLGNHPGVIELPAYALQIPPDSVAARYGIEPGLLRRIRAKVPAMEPGSDRITGLDYNLWWEAELLRPEFVAILKYNLDERLRGNRAPFLFGVHTDFYRDSWGSVETYEERRKAIEEFLDYATSLPEVRVVTYKEVADYMREPRHIKCF